MYSINHGQNQLWKQMQHCVPVARDGFQQPLAGCLHSLLVPLGGLEDMATVKTGGLGDLKEEGGCWIFTCVDEDLRRKSEKKFKKAENF
jgi:hypothetical protein